MRDATSSSFRSARSDETGRSFVRHQQGSSHRRIRKKGHVCENKMWFDAQDAAAYEIFNGGSATAVCYLYVPARGGCGGPLRPRLNVPTLLGTRLAVSRVSWSHKQVASRVCCHLKEQNPSEVRQFFTSPRSKA
mmetsp:Transcript_9965/g.27863  ORF Transcript_9965/g.27863 Transcript_9965/m.27863 type:complete len:134 (+) Transcript_9965:670-1071(+)